ncbi:MAG TPA: class I SAM-dependent methyltransferase [Gaiellales bacterium]|nr:class I SAM-dependent methyltransferase [Gaiellales bacterium]
MDVERLLEELPGQFADFPRSEVPLDRSLRPVLDAVDGLSEENNLALIGLAARHLGAGEAYVEAGTYRGRSLIAAALAGRAECIGIDNFSFDDSDPAALQANLERFGVAARARMLDGDAAAVLRAAELPPVGAFFYDADHSTEATRAAFEAVIPHLAGRALIVADNADWPKVRAAIDAFVDAHAEAELALRIAGRAGGQPWWWDGVDLIAWTRG